MQIELKLYKWNKETDLKIINTWYKNWNSSERPEWFFPEDVFIVHNVASISYYKTNSGIAYMENVISNPDCPTEVRQLGCEMLVNHIFNLAKSDGFKMMIGWTNHPSMAILGEKVGAKLTNYKYATMIKPLQNEDMEKLFSNFKGMIS